MDLYAYKREGVNETVVGAALSKADFDNWFKSVDAEHYLDKYETDMLTHLTNDEFQPFQTHVYVFEHESPEQQQQFIDKHGLLVGTRQRAIDRCIDMVNWEAPDFYDIEETRTIEQLNGLDVHDRHDKRTEEQKAADQALKELMKDAIKEGKLSGDSFAPAKKDGVHVTDIRTSVDADGNVEVDNVLAVKVEEGETNDKPVYGNLRGQLAESQGQPTPPASA